MMDKKTPMISGKIHIVDQTSELEVVVELVGLVLERMYYENHCYRLEAF